MKEFTRVINDFEFSWKIRKRLISSCFLSRQDHKLMLWSTICSMLWFFILSARYSSDHLEVTPAIPDPQKVCFGFRWKSYQRLEPEKDQKGFVSNHYYSREVRNCSLSLEWNHFNSLCLYFPFRSKPAKKFKSSRQLKTFFKTRETLLHKSSFESQKT